MINTKLLEALKECLPEGTEDWCDECGGNDSRCPSGCYVRCGRAIIAEAESSQSEVEPVGYIDREQLRRWDVLRGTDYEIEERAYIGFSKKPYTTDMTDCTLAVFTAPPTEAAIAEMALRKAMKVCLSTLHKFMPTNERSEVAHAIKNEIAALIPQPSALEELLMAVAKGVNMLALDDHALQAIVTKTLKEFTTKGETK